MSEELLEDDEDDRTEDLEELRRSWAESLIMLASGSSSVMSSRLSKTLKRFQEEE